MPAGLALLGRDSVHFCVSQGSAMPSDSGQTQRGGPGRTAQSQPFNKHSHWPARLACRLTSPKRTATWPQLALEQVSVAHSSVVRFARTAPPRGATPSMGARAVVRATAACSWRSVEGGTTALGARADAVLVTARCVWLLAVCHVRPQGASRPARETPPTPAVGRTGAGTRACVRVGLERACGRGRRAGVRPASQRRTRGGRQRRRGRRGCATHAPTRRRADAPRPAPQRCRRRGTGGRTATAGGRWWWSSGAVGRACPAKPFPCGGGGTNFPRGGGVGWGGRGPQRFHPRVVGVLRRLGGRGRGRRRWGGATSRGRRASAPRRGR